MTTILSADDLSALRRQKREQFNRRVSVGDLVTDRWENAREMGWGEGTSCYDNVLVIGDVRVGKNTWIGPNVILDGSGGGLVIGDYCGVGPGVQIFTHSSLRWTLSLGKDPYEKAPTSIGNGVFIASNAVIGMGVTIGDQVVIGAMSLVTKDVPSRHMAAGCPARITPLSDKYLR